MTDKYRLNDQGQAQADGVTDDEAVTADAESADESSPKSEIGTVKSGLPMEPDEQRAERLQGELDDARDKMLRLAAEFDNFRKRVARERVELVDRAQAAFVTKLLDVLDDLDRIVDDARNTPPDALREALALVDRKLWKELEAAGVERIDPAGRAFDPSEHEAVSTVPAPAPDKDHIVSATFQSGYRFKGQLVRPARVQVYSTQGAG